MNRKTFVRELCRSGCVLERHGKRHDVYLNIRNGRKAPVPRHAEIRDSLAMLILRQLGILPL